MDHEYSIVKTKIICTIGPATQSVEVLKDLMGAGMDVARVNFSHGDHEDHQKTIHNVRQAAEELGIHVPILGDLCGPKIRLGNVVEPFRLEEGDELIITVEDVDGTRARVGTTYAEFAQDVVPGNNILIDDGLVQLRVKSVDGPEVTCETVIGGLIKSKKGMNLPDVDISIPALTDKDKLDVEFGVAHGIDFFALSFVRQKKDVTELRDLIESKGKAIPIVSKIEKPEAIRDIIGIIRASDGIMVARGDLGVEMRTEDVPILQKMIIDKANYYNKPVITATQMLDSMIHHPRPTRAEASDVANAVFDGTDAVMLSAETSVGEFPIITVRTMDTIVRRAEERLPLEVKTEFEPQMDEFTKLGTDLCRAACQLAQDTYASAILCITKSGRTAQMLSKHRVMAPIFAFTESPQVARQINLLWGVEGAVVGNFKDTDGALAMVKRIALEKGYIKEGQTVVYVAGIPLRETHQVNMLKVDQA